MGFYGNIKNTSRTQFSFDKIYPNRAALEGKGNNGQTGATVDDIYAGRFVLVEYDSEVTKDQFLRAILYNGILYKSLPNSANAQLVPITKGDDGTEGVHNYYIIEGKYNFDKITYNEDGSFTFPEDRFVQLTGTNSIRKDEPYYTFDFEQYKFIPATDEETGEPLIHEALSYAEYKDVAWDKTSNNYFKNYNIDIGIYGVSRGYDSTVWQKVYTNGYPKYVMIAELNSVVPTFDMAADAPSIIPQIPHFDSDSTNVYYRIHWQPQWGMRLKASKSNLRTPFLRNNGTSFEYTGNDESSTLARQNDEKDYPSDETTLWTHSVFDQNNQFKTTEYFIPDNGAGVSRWGTKEDVELYDPMDAAVYYNKAGFDPAKISYSEDLTVKGWDNNTIKDEITMTPTGASGFKYKSHEKLGRESAQPDIQELSIMLPSIGDTMATIWDIVYGGRNIDPAAKTRNMDIQWYNAKAVSNKKGIRLVENNGPGRYTYNPKKASTFAGILNSAQDLMGMIITDEMPEKAEGANEEYIYYDKDTQKYYFKHKTFKYETKYTGIDGDEYPNEIPDDYNPYEGTTLNPWEKGYYYIDTATKLGTEFIMEDKFHPDYKYVEKDKVETAMAQIAVSSEYKPDGTFFYRTSDQYPSGANGTKGTTYRYFIASEESYDPTKTYYEFSRAPEEKQLPEGEAIYIPNTYYQERFNKVTLTEDSYEPNVYYYSLNFGGSGTEIYEKAKDEEFDPKKAYYKREYVLDTSLKCAESGVNYFRLTTQSGGSNAYYRQIKTAKEITNPSMTYLQYMPNLYYYSVDSENEADEVIGDGKYKLDTNTYASEEDFIAAGHTYFSIEIKYELVQGPDIIDITDENVEPVTRMHDINEFKAGSYETGSGKDLFYVYVDTANKKRYIEVNYNNFSQSYNPSSQKYELVVMNYSKIGSPYHKNIYYYQVTDPSDPRTESFLLDNNDDLTAGRTYYEFKPDNVPGYNWLGQTLSGYFAAGEFYVEFPEGSGLYIPADDYDKTKTYYNRSKILYVEEDSEGIYDKGAEWPMEVKKLPVGVKLATRTDVWEFQDLNGFSDNLNTLYGLLLRLQRNLNEKDNLTRETSTTRGSINLFNDLMHRFSKLVPGQFTLVDDYGRMHSAKLTTAQELNYAGQKGDNLAIIPKKEKAENALIAVNIDSNFKQPTISITHVKPEEIIKTTGETDLNNRNNDTITLQTFAYDDAGHIATEHNETYTLPYGFKTINLTNSTAVTELTTNNNSIVADNSKDAMTFAADNKWIRLAGTDGTTNKIQIAHALVANDFGEKKDNSQDYTPKFNSKFKVPVITTDNAGHITVFETEEVKIPGWEFIDNNSLDTSDVLLELTYNYDDDKDIGTLTKTRGNVDKLLIQDYELSENAVSVKLNNKDSIHGAFSKLQAQINNMDLDIVGGQTGDYIFSVSEEDGVITAVSKKLPSVIDTAIVGQFVNSVSEKYGEITISRTVFEPSVQVAVGADVNSAPTIGITLNSIVSDVQSLPIANVNQYGVTKLTSLFDKANTSLAMTGAAVQDAMNTLDYDRVSLGANQTISAISEVNGIIQVELQNIEIPTSQVTGLNTVIGNINTAITDAEDKAADDLKEAREALEESLTNANNRIDTIIGEVPEGKEVPTLADLEDSVNEINQKIGTKQDTLNSETVYGAIAAIIGTTQDTKEDKTINGLLAIIKDMQKTVNELTTTVNSLKAKVEEYHPTVEENPAE